MEERSFSPPSLGHQYVKHLSLSLSIYPSISLVPVQAERFSRRKNLFFAAIRESEFLISFQRRRNRRRCTEETGGILARQFWRATFWCPSWRPSAGGYRVSPAFTRHESPSNLRGGDRCASRAAPHHRKPGPSSSARMSRTIGRPFGTRLFTSNCHDRSREDDILSFE